MTKEQRFIEDITNILEEHYSPRHMHKRVYDDEDMRYNYKDGVSRVQDDIREALYRLKIEG